MLSLSEQRIGESSAESIMGRGTWRSLSELFVKDRSLTALKF
ncbi:MAG: hypothetical protein K0R09_359 [Clostridiales bacterium]|nr:hypothetical protein [Clostridiales bacterium]